MILTGKCKEDFEKWYENTYREYDCYQVMDWFEYPFEFQYGVYVDFFDSVGYCIEISIDYTRKDYGKPLYQWEVNDWNTTGFGHKDLVRHRQEARKSAIEKANELYNSK